LIAVSERKEVEIRVAISSMSDLIILSAFPLFDAIRQKKKAECF
jgi:hypothetical protein